MRPIFTVHAGEYLVGAHIEREGKNVWVPTKDTGVDLLVTNTQNTKAISLQVKFSKDFLPTMNLAPPIRKALRACFWFTLDKNKFNDSRADLWVFVLMGFAKDSYDYVVIKPSELRRKINTLKPNSPKRHLPKHHLYIWVTGHAKPKCWLARKLSALDKEKIAKDTFIDPRLDLTAYLNDWGAIRSL